MGGMGVRREKRVRSSMEWPFIESGKVSALREHTFATGLLGLNG